MMEAKYREIIVQRVMESWHNWTESEKKSRADKAVYDAAMRELEAHEAGVEEHLNMLESRGGTI